MKERQAVGIAKARAELLVGTPKTKKIIFQTGAFPETHKE
jgi:hypothetical protein